MTDVMTAEGISGLSVLRVKQGEAKDPLRACVRDAVENYFAKLDGHPCSGLYRMVLTEVERPLLETVMRHTRGNQSIAAELLGLSRGTLRKKLREYSLL